MNAASRSVTPQQRRQKQSAATSKATPLRSLSNLSNINPSGRSNVSPTEARMPNRTKAANPTVINLSRATPTSFGAQGNKVEKLNTSRDSIPSWLRSLLLVQRTSDAIAFLLCFATLMLYSWTVYTQQQWTKAFRQLETLQRNERHLTTANAVMKDHLAQEAENPGTGLVNPSRNNTILLPPTQERKFKKANTQTPQSESVGKTPLGY
jgi:hypothetical protein